MSKSTTYQIIILIFIFSIIAITYYNFFYKNAPNKLITSDKGNINSQTLNDQAGSKIDDIYYISKDQEGNSYEIFAQNGELDSKNLDILKLKNVRAIIEIKNSGIINVSSENALYNRNNLNTYFYVDVNLDFNAHMISSEIIDMNYIEKNIKISENVNYKNGNNILNTDIIEIDMITKISRIYMKRKTDKITFLRFCLHQTGSIS